MILSQKSRLLLVLFADLPRKSGAGHNVCKVSVKTESGDNEAILEPINYDGDHSFYPHCNTHLMNR